MTAVNTELFKQWKYILVCYFCGAEVFKIDKELKLALQGKQKCKNCERILNLEKDILISSTIEKDDG